MDDTIIDASESSTSGIDRGTAVNISLTVVLVILAALAVPLASWMFWYRHCFRHRLQHEEEGVQLEDQTNNAERAESHEDTTLGRRPEMLTSHSDTMSPPHPLVGGTDVRVPGHDRQTAHSGGQFRETPTDRPLTLSGDILDERGATGDAGEGAHNEREISTSVSSGHSAVGGTITAPATGSAAHDEDGPEQVVQRVDQVLPAQHTSGPGQTVVADGSSEGSVVLEGGPNSGESPVLPGRPASEPLETDHSSTQPEQLAATMAPLPKSESL